LGLIYVQHGVFTDSTQKEPGYQPQSKGTSTLLIATHILFHTTMVAFKI